MTRNETIQIIKKALKRRSGKTWSVTGGRGSDYGWITIDAPPSRRTWTGHAEKERDTGQSGGHMSPNDRQELGILLGLGRPVHHQGHDIPASSDYYQEHIDRAEGRPPSVIGKPYWD